MVTDSLGALIEQEQVKPVAFDWQGGEIYPGDSYFNINNDIVLEDDLKEYVEAQIGKAEIA